MNATALRKNAIRETKDGWGTKKDVSGKVFIRPLFNITV